MYKCKSLVVAEAVVEAAMQIINSDEGMPAALPEGDNSDFRTIVEAYQNGREQGLIVWPTFKSEICYYVCQSRRSDSICIYKGKYAMQSISEDAYKHPNTFAPGETEKAAEWLVLDLVELYIVYREKKAKSA